MPLTDDVWMREALAEAEKARALGEVPIGCVIVHDEKILARGHNANATENDPTAHAEIVALRRASISLGDRRLTGATAYVTLEPCAMCAGAFVLSRVARVVYGCADPKGGAVSTLFSIGRDARLNHTFEVTPGVLADESAKLLREFFEALRAQGKK